MDITKLWGKSITELYNTCIHDKEFHQRLHLYIQLPNDPNKECWLWTGLTDPSGYGFIIYGDYTLSAHRVTYAIEHGVYSKDLPLQHMCDLRTCVNPAHVG